VECGGKAQPRHRFRAFGKFLNVRKIIARAKARGASLPAAVQNIGVFAMAAEICEAVWNARYARLLAKISRGLAGAGARQGLFIRNP